MPTPQGQAKGGQKGERKILYWVDPMHPAYKSDKPGKAPDCGMDLVPVYAGEAAAEEALPPGAVRINPQKQQLIGVRLGRVELRPVRKTIQAVAKLTYDETRIAHVHTKFDGWIDQVFVDYVGKLVAKGQPLFSIYSPELVSTQREYLLALKSKKYLAEAPYPEVSAGAVSLAEATRERLRLWDVTDEQIKKLEETGQLTRTLTFYSPVDGFVLERKAYENVRVTPDMDLYTIADLSRIWANAEVYEYEAPDVSVGQEATMEVAGLPNVIFRGHISYIYPQVDVQTRTLKVRLDFDNPDFRLRPDQYATVNIEVDLGRQLVVPEEAVLDSGTEQIVFVAREGGAFEPRRVELGGKVDDGFIIRSGLKAGERIVTSGNFLIDSESRLKSAMGAMQH
jgi:RND family efflux transporter MFP subunit